MFKRITLFSLLIGSGLQLHSFGLKDFWRSKPKLNIESTFAELEQLVINSNNMYAKKAFEKLTEKKSIYKKDVEEKLTTEQINNLIFEIKCNLVPPARDWARSRAEAEYALKHEAYRKAISEKHPQLIAELSGQLKTCSDISSCEAKLTALFGHLLLKDLIIK